MTDLQRLQELLVPVHEFPRAHPVALGQRKAALPRDVPDGLDGRRGLRIPFHEAPHPVHEGPGMGVDARFADDQ